MARTKLARTLPYAWQQPSVPECKPSGIPRPSHHQAVGVTSTSPATEIATTSTPNGDGSRLSFLELPPEVRNNIYAKVIEVQPEAFITSRTRNILACRTALPRVCKQVREEFVPMLYLFAEIIADVKDFDYGRVIRFLNSLEETSLSQLPGLQATNDGRVITVELRICENFSKNADKMTRWLNRIEHPTAKGAKVQTKYEVVGGETKIPEGSTWTNYRNLRDYRTFLPIWHKRHEKERTKAEIDKIFAVFVLRGSRRVHFK